MDPTADLGLMARVSLVSVLQTERRWVSDKAKATGRMGLNAAVAARLDEKVRALDKAIEVHVGRIIREEENDG